MKYFIRNFGFFIIGLGVTLSVFEFLLENSGIVLIFGIIIFAASYFIKNWLVFSKQIILILLFIWSLPSFYFRSKFRKIVYQTDDWKINIKPLFIKELKGLIFKLYPNDKVYLKVRRNYIIYLVIYFGLFIFYLKS